MLRPCTSRCPACMGQSSVCCKKTHVANVPRCCAAVRGASYAPPKQAAQCLFCRLSCTYISQGAPDFSRQTVASSLYLDRSDKCSGSFVAPDIGVTSLGSRQLVPPPVRKRHGWGRTDVLCICRSSFLFGSCAQGVARSEPQTVMHLITIARTVNGQYSDASAGFFAPSGKVSTCTGRGDCLAVCGQYPALAGFHCR